MSDEPAIVRLLRGSPEPLRIAEIAAALRIPHSDQLREAVRSLVQAGRLKRHHNPDGILRYGVGENVDAAPLRGDAPRVRATTQEQLDRIRSQLEDAGGLMQLGTLRACFQEIPYSTFWRLTDVLVARRLVRRFRTTANSVALQLLGADVEALPAESPGVESETAAETDADPADDALERRLCDDLAGLNHAPEDPVLIALRASAEAARDALDAYLAQQGRKA